MLFVNLSLDKIVIIWWKNKIFLAKKNLERILPQVLKKLFDEKFFSKIFVINWPGSFTSIRVGTLCLNMLNFLYKNKIDFYNISKIDLYSYFVSQKSLPSKGILHIWQTKNYWLYDFLNQDYKQIIFQEVENYKQNVFFDETFQDVLGNKVEVDFDWLNLILKFGNDIKKIDIKKIGIKKDKSIKPIYIIKPNITIKQH